MVQPMQIVHNNLPKMFWMCHNWWKWRVTVHPVCSISAQNLHKRLSSIHVRNLSRWYMWWLWRMAQWPPLMFGLQTLFGKNSQIKLIKYSRKNWKNGYPYNKAYIKIYTLKYYQNYIKSILYRLIGFI